MKINRNNMKNTLLLAVAASLIGASPLMAADLYITGSTAFRSNVHDACTKMLNAGFTEFTGIPSTGGDTKTGNAAAQWTMTGTAAPGIGVSGSFTIHALFTGSIQGTQVAQASGDSQKLFYLDSLGHTTTNTPTIAFSDASTLVTPYPVDGVNFQEEQVAVLPFAMFRSPALAGTAVTNVTWDQFRQIIANGRLPLSSWTGNASDTGTFVYLLKRTKDSGTLRTETAEAGNAFSTGGAVYLYDVTNHLFYKGTNTLNSSAGGCNGIASIGVVGPPGNGNANLSQVWGPGYVGGGDIATVLKNGDSQNQSISFLSMSDGKSLLGGAWSQMISFDGVWPVTNSTSLSTSTTNNWTPITSGQFPLWGYEICVYPLNDPSSIHGDQNLTVSQLGDQNTPGTILGVLDGQSYTAGSLYYEIQNSKTGVLGTTAPSTAILIHDMHATRTPVGGPISP